MRDIKFKFWDTKSNTMYPSFTLASLWATVEVNNSLIPLQFTGLKDKNGVDIYEGDIVRAKSHNPSDYTIEFIEGGFCGTNPKIKGYPCDINHFYDSTGCHIEVIGNKF